MKDPRGYEGCFGTTKDSRHMECRRKQISIMAKNQALPILDKKVDGKRVFVYYFAEDSFLNRLRDKLW